MHPIHTNAPYDRRAAAMPRLPRPPWWRAVLLLPLLLLPLASAFHHPRHRLLQLQQPHQRLLARLAGGSSTGTSADHDDAAALPPRFLVLFKGGPAGNMDQGTSLGCLREMEFRGLARALLDMPEGLLTFTDALEADLSLAAGTARRSVDDDDDGDDDSDGDYEDDGSSSSNGGGGGTDGGGGASSLVYVEGIESAEALRRVASRAVLVHAAYEVRALGHDLSTTQSTSIGIAHFDL